MLFNHINQKLKDPIELRNFFQEFKNKQKDISDMIRFYEELFDQNDSILVDIFQKFLGKKEEIEYSVLKENVIKKLDENNRISNICTLFKVFVEQLLDQNQIQTNLKEMSIFSQLNQQNLKINNFELEVDKNCHFYLLKENYNDQNILNKQEKEILTADFKSDEYPSYIAHVEEASDKIIFPFLPNQTLFFFIQNANEFNLISPVDKFVIIKETAIGLQQLHANQIYNLNLSSSSIFINNDKDSYIFNFAYDAKSETKSKRSQNFFYQHPNLVKNPRNLVYKKNDGSEFVKYDIYSYGVLIYEILTESSPQNLFDKNTSQVECDRLEKGYGTILKQNFDKNDFDKNYGLNGIQKIMGKCFDLKEPYSSMKDVLNDLNSLDIYKQSQNEIDSRINNSKNIDQYKCTLSDIFINYFLVDESKKGIIKSFLKECKESEIIDENENLISQAIKIFNLFDKCTEIDDKEMLCNEYFYNIIQGKSLDINLYNNISNPMLMTLSILINRNPSIDLNKIEPKKFLVSEVKTCLKPIASLSNFLKNKFIEKEMIPIFLCNLAKEISYLHSNNLYHGSISEESIGVYYNVEEKKFLPLIIPFYVFYNEKTTSHCMQSDDYIAKKQQKDVKNFIKLIENIENKDSSLRIPREILKKDSSIISITNGLFEFYNFKQEKINYSSYQIKYSTIHNIFAGPLKYSKIWRIFRYFLISKNNYFDVIKIVTDIFNSIAQNSFEKFDDIIDPEIKMIRQLKFIQEFIEDLKSNK